VTPARPVPRLTDRARFWVVLPSTLLILADLMVTLVLQPASYWAGVYRDRSERSPLGAALLTAHPAVFTFFMLGYAVVVILLVSYLRRPWDRALALAVVVGHTAGIYGWLAPRNYWSMIPFFLLVGALTVLCWRRADASPER
jgi:hypothetical protein